jgi:hypothetical protein
LVRKFQRQSSANENIDWLNIKMGLMGKLDYNEMNQMEVTENGIRSSDHGDSNKILHSMNSREFLEKRTD